MAKLISLRFMGTAALCSAAFVLAGVAPRLHAAPVGSGMSVPLPANEPNRLRKADTLLLFHPHTSAWNFRQVHRVRARCHLVAILLSARSSRQSSGGFTGVARPNRTRN